MRESPYTKSLRDFHAFVSGIRFFIFPDFLQKSFRVAVLRASHCWVGSRRVRSLVCRSYDMIDKLTGDDYENAIANMSNEQRNIYAART